MMASSNMGFDNALTRGFAVAAFFSLAVALGVDLVACTFDGLAWAFVAFFPFADSGTAFRTGLAGHDQTCPSGCNTAGDFLPA